MDLPFDLRVEVVQWKEDHAGPTNVSGALEREWLEEEPDLIAVIGSDDNISLSGPEASDMATLLSPCDRITPPESYETALYTPLASWQDETYEATRYLVNQLDAETIYFERGHYYDPFLMEELDRVGVTVIEDDTYWDVGVAAEREAMLDKIDSSGADAVVVREQATQEAIDAHGFTGHKAAVLAEGPRCTNDIHRPDAEPLADGWLYTRNWYNPELDGNTEKSREAVHELGEKLSAVPYAAETYNATWVVIEALKKLVDEHGGKESGRFDDASGYRSELRGVIAENPVDGLGQELNFTAQGKLSPPNVWIDRVTDGVREQVDGAY